MSALAGRVAIVTGGARGIGAAISTMLIERGASVVVADMGCAIDGRDGDPSVARGFSETLGDRAVPCVEDMADPASAAEAVALACERFGGIDILINNAAILRDAFVFRGSTGDWDAVIRNNLSGAYYLIAAATPVMRDQAKAGRGGGERYEWGRIVNIVSSAAYIGNYGQASYASAKGGLTGLMRIAALDMARTGVTCNAVAPFARSRVTETIVPANDEQAAYKERALRVPTAPVAELVGYLCSAAASDVTGQIFGVRGREVFLFSQPRPAARIVAEPGGWDANALAAAVDSELRSAFAPLETDLEAFNTEPLV